MTIQERLLIAIDAAASEARKRSDEIYKEVAYQAREGKVDPTLLVKADASIKDCLVEFIEKEFQEEFYLVDHLLAMCSPGEPEFTGSCPTCAADLSPESTETHRDDCPIAEVIVKRGP